MNDQPHCTDVALDPWHKLTQFTPARIALGRSGISLPTKALLDFQLAHAKARDAVHMPLDFAWLSQRLKAAGLQTLQLQTQVENQAMYLQRPDLGRWLNIQTQELLQATKPSTQMDAVVIVADGLSTKAIEVHAESLLKRLLPALQTSGYQYPPIMLVKYGRVAVGDAIAAAFSARLCIVLIGERPGLSSPDSMSIYFTYQANPGITTDANRNCISNIHKNGLDYPEALKKLLFLIRESEKLKLSGVNLKDDTMDFMPEPSAVLVK